MFSAPTIGRASVGWCIHMVYIHGECGDWMVSAPTIGTAFVGWFFVDSIYMLDDIQCMHIYGGGMFGILGPGHREIVCGLVTDPCTELVWANSVVWLEQKCTIPAPWRTAVRNRVPAGLLSSRDCLPHRGLLWPVCQLQLDCVWHSLPHRHFVPRDLPSPSRSVLPVCVSLSVHVCRISPFCKDTVVLG